jgi:putative transposase
LAASLACVTSLKGAFLGIVEGAKEDKASWLAFLKHLKERGLAGVRLIISDACLGLVEAAAEVFPDARWQRCVVHWYRNAFAHVPRAKMAEVALMLKAIHASESRAAAEATAERVRARLEEMKLPKLAEWIAATVGETLTYHWFPSAHWHRIRTNNALERLLREIRRRTRVSIRKKMLWLKATIARSAVRCF